MRWRCRTTSADMVEFDNNARWRRTPFVLSCQHLLFRKALLSRRVRTLACSPKSCFVVCFLAGGISYSSGPPIFVYTLIHIFPHIVEIGSQLHMHLQTRPPFAFDYLQWEMASGKSVSPSFSAPGFDIAAGQKLVGCIPETLVASDFMGGLVYYLVQHKFAHGELYQEVQDFYRKNEIQDQMPHLTPSLLIKSGKERKFSPSLLQRQATLADSWAEGYVGGNNFENTVAPVAKQPQQSWDPEAFGEAGLRLTVVFVGMRIIRDSFHCKTELHMFLEQPHQRMKPSLVWTYRT